MHDMDAIATQLLALLQDDAKVSLARMGEAVGLSAPAALERVRKLEAAGIIRGYRAILSPKNVGLSVGAFIGVAIDGVDDVQSFCEYVRHNAHVLEAHHVTGSWTLMLKVRTASNSDLEKLLIDLRRQMGVTRTETLVVLSTAVENTKLPVAPTSTPTPQRPRSRKR
jgi:Lrp/AsnC family leucine-responsive transcriptional regulator